MNVLILYNRRTVQSKEFVTLNIAVRTLERGPLNKKLHRV